MKRPKLLIGFMLAVIMALSVVRIGIENSISTTGIELVRLQGELDEYKKENYQLEEKYLAESSLTEIASKAATLGFVDAKKTVYLSTPLPLALKQ
jgi:cell division protein FtsL